MPQIAKEGGVFDSSAPFVCVLNIGLRARDAKYSLVLHDPRGVYTSQENRVASRDLTWGTGIRVEGEPARATRVGGSTRERDASCAGT